MRTCQNMQIMYEVLMQGLINPALAQVRYNAMLCRGQGDGVKNEWEENRWEDEVGR